MAARIIVRIELTPAAKGRLNEMSGRTGMTQVALLSRLVEWFSGQSQIIQGGVLGHFPKELTEDIGKMIVTKMAEPEPRKKGG